MSTQAEWRAYTGLAEISPAEQRWFVGRTATKRWVFGPGETVELVAPIANCINGVEYLPMTWIPQGSDPADWPLLNNWLQILVETEGSGRVVILAVAPNAFGQLTCWSSISTNGQIWGQTFPPPLWSEYTFNFFTQSWSQTPSQDFNVLFNVTPDWDGTRQSKTAFMQKWPADDRPVIEFGPCP